MDPGALKRALGMEFYEEGDLAWLRVYVHDDAEIQIVMLGGEVARGPARWSRAGCAEPSNSSPAPRDTRSQGASQANSEGLHQPGG
jgi:hypothetical protein